MTKIEEIVSRLKDKAEYSFSAIKESCKAGRI